MTNRRDLFSDLAQVANGAASALSSMREEIQTVRQSRQERTTARNDEVIREDFDALSLRVDALAARIAVIEARLDSELENSKSSSPVRKKAAKKSSK